MTSFHDDEAFFHRLQQFIHEAVQKALTSHSHPKPLGYAPDQLLTEDQVAALLGCSKRTLQSWRKAMRKGPRATMVGALARYRYSDVVTFIDKSGQ